MWGTSKTLHRYMLAGAVAVAGMCVAHFAMAASSVGHVTNPDPCVDPKDSGADPTIAACLKALDSHTLTREAVAVALNNLTVAYVSKGDFRSALNAINASIKLQGDTWQSRLNRGQIYARMGKTDLALADLGRSIELSPDQAVSFRARGRIRLSTQDFAPAVADLTQALALQPNDAVSLVLRAEARRRLGEDAGAEADLAQAKKIDPNIRPVMNDKARTPAQ